MMSIPLLIVESGIETPIALLSDCILSRISSLDQEGRTSVSTLLYQVMSTTAPGEGGPHGVDQGVTSYEHGEKRRRVRGDYALAVRDSRR